MPGSGDIRPTRRFGSYKYAYNYKKVVSSSSNIYLHRFPRKRAAQEAAGRAGLGTSIMLGGFYKVVKYAHHQITDLCYRRTKAITAPHSQLCFSSSTPI